MSIGESCYGCGRTEDTRRIREGKPVEVVLCPFCEALNAPKADELATLRGPFFAVGDEVESLSYPGAVGVVEAVELVGPVELGAANVPTVYQSVFVRFEPAANAYGLRTSEASAYHFERCERWSLTDKGERAVAGIEAIVAHGKQPQFCERCGVGAFIFVAERARPELCLDCAEAL